MSGGLVKADGTERSSLVGKLAFSQVENFVENGGFILFGFGQSDPQNPP